MTPLWSLQPDLYKFIKHSHFAYFMRRITF